MESSGRQLLENVTITEDENGSQFMIQRMSVDNAQLLSSELLQHHNGLVVDLGGDFIPVNYTSEDLLSQDLTEEDRNLAAALVAVQFSQQQKQQQTQQDGGGGGVIINTTLPSLVAAGSLDENKVTLNDQQVILQDNKTGYLQIVDAENLYKHPEFAQYDESDSSIQLIKTEDEHDGEQRTSKKSLPHKKRISRKLKKVVVAKKAHKCNLCEQVFTAEEYAEHQQLCQTTITPIPNAFLCQLCNSAFADQLQFFEHLKIHYEPIGQHQVDDDEEEQHVQDEEDEEEEVEQVIAEPVLKEASAKKRLKLDPETQKETLLTSILQLTCMECNKTFRRQKSFDLHVKEYHSKDEMNEFSEPEDLMAGIDVNAASEMEEDNKAWYRDDELHATEEDLKEMEAKEHVCHNCQQPFPIRAILLQHLLTCRSSNDGSKVNITEIKEEYKKKKTKKADMECTICDRKFTHRNSLVYHMRGHTGDRPHQCDQCGKSFFGASALKVHLRLHSGEKPYRCEFCGRNFRQWGDLKYHCISIHSDQKQYQCEYCGKDFARKYSLIVHRRIHTGEKNYRCEFCGKTFRASSYLQNHRRIHTGEKPHPCEICGKRFRVRSDMKRHLRTHTRRRIGRSIAMPMNGELKIEDADAEMHHESEDTNESILKETENDAAVQSLQYEQETLEAVRDGNTLYVMPILIT